MSYQDGYRFVTVFTHGDLIVLSHWDTRPTAVIPDSPLSHIVLTLSQSVLIMLCARLELTSINFKVIGSTRSEFEPVRFGFPELPKLVMDTLLIRPHCLVMGDRTKRGGHREEWDG